MLTILYHKITLGKNPSCYLLNHFSYILSLFFLKDLRMKTNLSEKWVKIISFLVFENWKFSLPRSSEAEPDVIFQGRKQPDVSSLVMGPGV